MRKTRLNLRGDRCAMPSFGRFTITLLGLLSLGCTTGCYVPLHSPATPAACLSDVYRMPERAYRQPLNLASLAVPAPEDYILGPNDTLEVSVAGLSDPGPDERVRPINVTIMANGSVRLPIVGEVNVSQMNLAQAQQAIDKAYSAGVLKSPKTSVMLVDKATLNVPVIGEVVDPGVQSLPRYENDVAHAVASAAGLTQFAAEVVEIHRQMTEFELDRRLSQGVTQSADEPLNVFLEGVIESDGAVVDPQSPKKVVIRIPLKGGSPSIVVDEQVFPQEQLSPDDVTLRPGDVVVVPRQPDEVFIRNGAFERKQRCEFQGFRTRSTFGERVPATEGPGH